MGKIIAKAPKPQRQLYFSSNSSAALGPAKAVIMYGEDVNAYARARFFSLEESAVMTSTVYVMPPKPRV
jgi:hypothetical protein